MSTCRRAQDRVATLGWPRKPPPKASPDKPPEDQRQPTRVSSSSPRSAGSSQEESQLSQKRSLKQTRIINYNQHFKPKIVKDSELNRIFSRFSHSGLSPWINLPYWITQTYAIVSEAKLNVTHNQNGPELNDVIWTGILSRLCYEIKLFECNMYGGLPFCALSPPSYSLCCTLIRAWLNNKQQIPRTKLTVPKLMFVLNENFNNHH